MDRTSFRYHSSRLAAMLRYKGLRYTASYLGVLALYFSDFPSKVLFTRLLPRFRPYPRFIEVEVTTRCHLRCVMCEHSYWDEAPRDMTLEQFTAILDQFPSLRWLGVTGIGSSFLNRDFVRMLKYAKSKAIYVELYDTLYHIDEEVAGDLIELGVDRLIMSIDAASKSAYERIRVGSSFDRVTANLRNLIRLKRQRRARYPEITFHYVVCRENLDEVPQFIDLIHSMTSGEDVGVLFSGLLHQFRGIEDLVVDVPSEVMEAATVRGRRQGIKVTWNRNTREREAVSRCTEWMMPFIFVDGTVIPCCAGNQINDREFQRRTSLGNLFDRGFRSIWQGEEYSKFRQMLGEGSVPAACARCPIYDVGGGPES